MSVSGTVRIGADLVDIALPCDVVTALKKMQLKLAVGGVRETVRLDGEEATFMGANDRRLLALIAHYESAGILLSQVLAFGRHNPDKWFCSEICAAAFGLPDPQRVSPQFLFDVVTWRAGAPAIETQAAN